MAQNPREIEARIRNAIDAYKHDPGQKMTDIAREFGVPYQRLCGRLQGKHSRVNKHPVNCALDKQQEDALKHWVYKLDQAHFAPTVQQVQHCANSILCRNHTDPNQRPREVSKMWVNRFFKRLPDGYKRMKKRPMDPKRLHAEDVAAIMTWYDRLGILMRQYQIQPSDIYNFDEIGFLEGQGRPETVITRFPEKNESLGSSFSRNSVTVIECVSADGSVLPPCIILTGKGFLEDWFTHSEMPESWLIATSQTGYTSDDTAFKWLHHFDKYSKRKQTGVYRLLIMDNHGSHLTYEFIEYCENNQILLYTLTPHTTHILQPLDGKPFQQYKHYHAKAVNNAARWGERAFEKRQFLEELPGIRQNTFKSQTIKSGFAERGIYPFNPNPTLEALEKRMIPIPDLQIWTGDKDAEGNAPPSPPTPSSNASSPKSIQKLRHHISKAEKSLGEIKHIVNNASPGLTNRIEKVFSGSLMQAELRAQHEDDLDCFHLAAKRQNRPKSRRQVQSLSSTGVLSVKDANRHIEARKEEEDQGMRRRAVKRGARFRTNQTPTDENDPRMERIPVENGDDVFFWIDK